MTRTSIVRAVGALALGAALTLPALSPAFAYGHWEHHGGWHGGHAWHGGGGGWGWGAGAAGAAIGLGIGAAIGSTLAAPYYATPYAYPPPAVYYGG